MDFKTAPLLGRFLHLGHFCTGLFSPYRIPSSIRDFLAAFAPAAVFARKSLRGSRRNLSSWKTVTIRRLVAGMRLVRRLVKDGNRKHHC